jgi:hypothetical protein
MNMKKNPKLEKYTGIAQENILDKHLDELEAEMADFRKSKDAIHPLSNRPQLTAQESATRAKEMAQELVDNLNRKTANKQ